MTFSKGGRQVVSRYAYFNCSCGYHFTVEGGDIDRCERIRNMKVRLHQRSCSGEYWTDNDIQRFTKAQTKKCQCDTQRLIQLKYKNYGEDPSPEQLQCNFIEILNQY